MNLNISLSNTFNYLETRKYLYLITYCKCLLQSLRLSADQIVKLRDTLHGLGVLMSHSPSRTLQEILAMPKYPVLDPNKWWYAPIIGKLQDNGPVRHLLRSLMVYVEYKYINDL